MIDTGVLNILNQVIDIDQDKSGPSIDPCGTPVEFNWFN